jgi:type II secretory pathway predicted ATPase ExeA
MYEQYYGLHERPFDLTPNPRFLFLSRRHREALAHLRYGLSGRPGITMIVGEVGTGKTTLVRAALSSPEVAASRVVHLSNPTLTRNEFYEYVADGFEFGEAAGASKARFVQRLESVLAGEGRGVLALVVDEAQSLSHELLEEVRLLTNIHGFAERSLTVVLVGQPELAARMAEPSLRQLKQRITLRCDLRPFELKETAAYITSRVRIGGGSAEALFTRDAIVAIHEHAGGIPRTISVICENALTSGFAAEVKPVGRDIVLEVCRDFDLGDPAPRAERREPAAALARAPLPAPAVAPPPVAARPARLPPDARPLFGDLTRTRRFSFF